MSARELRTLGLVTLVLALGTLVANAWFLIRTTQSLQQASGEADRVRGIVVLNRDVLSLLRDAETGQRGFLLTGGEDYLEPYHVAVRTLPGDMTRLAAAISSETDQSRRFGVLRELVDLKLQELSEAIEIRRSAGQAPAIEIVQGGQGKHTMDRVRQVSLDIEAAESIRLAETLGARQHYARQTRLFAFLGSALLALLVSGGFVALTIADDQRQRLAKELAHARDLLETTLYSIGDAVIATDAEGRVSFMNRIASELTGCDEGRARGAPLRDVFQIHNEYSGDEIETPVAKVMREGVIAGLANHTLLVSRDGRRIPIDDSAAPIRHGGQIVGVVLVFRDISGRRRAEHDAAYMAAIMQSTDDAVLGNSLDGIIQTWNAGAERIYGYRAAEIVGHRMTDLIPPDRLHEEVEVLQKLGAGQSLEHFETVRRTKEGGLVDVSLTISPIRDGAERIIGASQVARDVTRQKMAERHLRDSEAKFRAYLEFAAQGIVTADAGGRIQLVNAKTEELFAYSRDELEGKPLETLVPERLRQALVDHRANLSVVSHARRVGAEIEFTGVRRDGTEFPVEIALNFVSLPEGPLAIALISDITERKRAEQQLQQTQKLESLGILAGGIAHDFNNLLTGILGNASLALNEIGPDSPAREPIKHVIGAGEKAAQLTHQMLAYSGKGQFFVRRIELSSQIRETVPLIKAAVPATVELRFDLQEDLPAIEADLAQIQQLIMNLIINGAEAIPEGQAGTVTIATRRQDVDEDYIRRNHNCRAGELKPGVYVVFEVTDTGCGMDDATQSRIFDPFFTTKFTGRGLGLAAVMGIVRGNAGCIRLKSAPGQGTVFGILLPAVEQPPETKLPIQEWAPQDLLAGSAILVVDDEEIVRKFARQTLELHGCEVLLAENGAHGLEIFRRELDRIQCVVLDMTMPVMSGEEALAQMKMLRSDIPVVLSSGYSESEASRRFEGKGLAGFLQKPYKAAALAEIVRDAIRRK